MLQVAPTIRSNHTSDGATVLDIHRGQMYRLNPVGSKSWKGFGTDSITPKSQWKLAQDSTSLAIAESDLRDSWNLKDTTSSSPAPLAVRFRRSIPLSGSIAADHDADYVIVLGENRDAV